MPNRFRFANLSLTKQVLIPFILLLLLLALGTLIGGKVLLQERLEKSVQQRLEHVQKLAYQDFKHQERLLAKHVIDAKLMLPVTLDRLQEHIHSHDRQAQLLSSDLALNNLPAPLRDLAIRTQQSSEPLVSIILDQPSQDYNLVACLWLPDRYLFLKRPLGRAYLDELAERLQRDFFLFDRRGALIGTSSKAPSVLPQLTSRELNQLHSGTPTSSYSNTGRAMLFSFTPLPLANEGLFILGSAEPLEPIEQLIQSHSIYLLTLISLTLLLGICLYRALLVRSFSPLQALLETSWKIKSGNRDSRVAIDQKRSSQLTELGEFCNSLLDELTEKDELLAGSNEKIAIADELKSHNRQLRQANLELEARNLNLKQQNQELSALFQITQSMVSTLDPQVLQERIIQALKSTLHCSKILLLQLPPGSEQLQAIRGLGFQNTEIKSLFINLGQGLIGEAAVNQKFVYCANLARDEEAQEIGSERFDHGSLLALPMLAQNRLLGVIALLHNEPEAFNNIMQQIAMAIANQAGIAIENARLFEKTKTLSATDELTGLANRRQFQEYLHRELAQSRRFLNHFSLLMIDIDHFKLYNDWHGHLKGDVILKRIAKLLLQNTRGIDLVARFGGEEYVILLPKTDKSASMAVAEKLRHCIEKEIFPDAIKSQPAGRLTISIGAASFPEDSIDVYDLLNLADAAVYQAKKQGRNSCVGFHPESSNDAETTASQAP